ncbi:hypothetical protein PsW64_04796 [Pseudovibrio sp. W64]|uniref:hypothetical protein n=1 Tax=unclassified Pseudovibrio TaxID=2627060 RepID=UPI0007AEAD04|nr:MULTISPECIES: hypothetical protein [unclassified Pseudovibrio]KZK76637.1 hypothetical protein PsW64_04796 [Pseudovibrio sp. W64]KZL00512.1 hypothetical protein PsW74_02938 [Pseudovibrio sp. W74]KZL07687.1 hypothetical protein PsAD14_04077 [Pseudovibrio sp. Ad14]
MDLAPRRKKAPQPFPVANLLPRSDKEQEITLERLLNAQKVIATLIAAGNTKYLPIFQRLKHEIKEFQQREDDLALALRIAKDD